MAKNLKELLLDIPEEQREDYLADPANRAEIERAVSSGNAAPAGAEVGSRADGTSRADGAVPDEYRGAPEAASDEDYGGAGYYGGYAAKEYGYSPSPAVAAARAALAKLNEPSAYSSQWQEKLSAAVSRILDRKPFSYDYSSDPVYIAYGNEYRRLGRNAAEDAVGRAAAYTGGYSNSYAASAGAAAYGRYISELTDRIPELYAAALKRYDSETAGEYENVGMLRALENDRYSRYKDEREYLADRLNDEISADIRRYSAEDDARYRAGSLAQKREQAENELRFKAAAAENELKFKASEAEKERAFKAGESAADRAYSAEKQKSELAYKTFSDALKYGVPTAETEDERGTEVTVKPLNTVKREFYSLLTSQGSAIAFSYIDGLVSGGKLSIQAARSVLAECGALDEYLAKKRGADNGSERKGGGKNAALTDNSLN